MRWVRTVDDVRAAEKAVTAHTTEAVLIQRASWAVARRAGALLGGAYGRRVLVVAGPGHNGADAMWAGVHLARRGASVTARLVRPEDGDEHLHAARAALRAAGGQVSAEPVAGAAPYDLGIDGLSGLGYQRRTGPGEQRLAAAAAELRDACELVVSVDLPSGVIADTGDAAPWSVRADVTVTFGALKPGLVVGRGADLAGVVDVVDIGLPDDPTTGSTGVLDADDVAALLPAPAANSTKYTRGVVGLLAGSPAYVGAAVLAAGGALRAGAGMVRLHADEATITAVRTRWPEVVGVVLDLDGVRADRRVDVWVVGPGIGTDEPAVAAVRAVLAGAEPVLLDADAITVVAQQPALLADRRATTVLTPHSGEFARLTGAAVAETAADSLGATRRAAAELGATVLLKGLRTVVAAPDGDARINPTGTPWLASAGTGDVLSGAIGALLAGGLGPLDAAACAAWLHGLAGRLAASGAPLLAMDVVRCWPDAVRATRMDRQALAFEA